MDKSKWTNEQWEEYLTEGHRIGDDELSRRLDERNEIIDTIMNSDEDEDYNPPEEIIGLETEGKMDPKYGGVISYKTMANGDHVDQFGDVISTAESRAKEDIPQWKKLEIGRLEIFDNVVIPGPNALPKDEEQYGKNRKLTNIHKTRPQYADPNEDPKPTKIMPDDPNYTPLEKALNWASETYHGPTHVGKWSRVAAALGEDNDYHPMTYVEAEAYWNQHNRNARWTMVMDTLDPGVDNSTEEVPVEEAPVEVEQKKSIPTKIMPDDPNYTPQEKAINWARETHHGPKHQERWNRVAAALGVDNGYEPYTYSQIEHLWDQFGANRRWTMAMKAYEEMYDVK